MSRPVTTLTWLLDGEQHLGKALEALSDEELDAPSLLPGWTRRRLIAHLTRNAYALVNLLTWARTGIETPMYPSPDAREADISATASLPGDELRSEMRAAGTLLCDDLLTMPADAWAAEVRTAQGRTVPASAVSWMRCREVWMHAVDLDAGVGFVDIPDAVAEALVDDVFRMWTGRDVVPDITVTVGDSHWGTGSLAASGTLPDVTAWLTGRSAGADVSAEGELPSLPRWL